MKQSDIHFPVVPIDTKGKARTVLAVGLATVRDKAKERSIVISFGCTCGKCTNKDILYISLKDAEFLAESIPATIKAFNARNNN